MGIEIYHFITELEIHHYLFHYHLLRRLRLFLAVCRTRVIHGLSLMALPSMSSRGSVDRAPARYLEGHGFYSRRGIRFFLCSTLVSC